MSAARTSPYAWIVLMIAFLGQMLTVGMIGYGFGMFTRPVAESLGLTLAQATSGVMLAVLGNAIWSPVVGRLLDRLPPRLIISGGGCCSGRAPGSSRWRTALRSW